MFDKSRWVITGGIGVIAVILASLFVSGSFQKPDALSAVIVENGTKDVTGDTKTDMVTQKMSPVTSRSVTVSPLLSPVTSRGATMSPSMSPSTTIFPAISQQAKQSTKSPTPSPVTTKTPSPIQNVTPTPRAAQTSTPSPTRTPSPSSTPSPTPTDTPTPLPTATPTPSPTETQNSVSKVVFNEIAWMGTKAQATDEWIELYNIGLNSVDLSGWKITDDEGKVNIKLSGSVSAGGFFLIERTDDSAIDDIQANFYGSFGNGLSNAGENLTLFDASGTPIDSIDCSSGWFFGVATPDYISMEKKSISGDNSSQNWGANDGITKNGTDAKGNPINGTPGRRNSVATD